MPRSKVSSRCGADLSKEQSNSEYFSINKHRPTLNLHTILSQNWDYPKNNFSTFVLTLLGAIAVQVAVAGRRGGGAYELMDDARCNFKIRIGLFHCRQNSQRCE